MCPTGRPRYSTVLAALALGLGMISMTACSGGSSGGTPAAQQSVTPSTTPGANPDPVPDPQTVLKVLGLYTPGVESHYADPDLRVQHLFNVANDVLQTSGVALELQLAHLERVDYPDGPGAQEALEAVTLATHTAFSTVAQLRDDTAADVVVLFRPYTGDGLCGYAWIGGYQTDGDFSNPAEPDFAYSTVAVDCSDYTLLHEVGHNLGLAHSRREDPDGGSLRHGAGHGAQNDFVTIMATASEFNAVRLPLLANPGLTCNGNPCGIPAADDVNGADAVLALSISKDQVAGYR